MKTKSVILVGLMSAAFLVRAQETEKERMDRDVEVAENILSTLIKQQSGKREIVIPLNVEGEYKTGKVQFNVPAGGISRTILAGGDILRGFSHFPPMLDSAGETTVHNFTFDDDMTQETHCRAGHMKHAERRRDKSGKAEKPMGVDVKIYKSKQNGQKFEETEETNAMMGSAMYPIVHALANFDDKAMDSIDMRFNEQLTTAAQTFIADYGDLLTALKDDDKIVVTTKSNRNDYSFFQNPKQKYVTVAGKVSDVRQYKKGVISRAQLMERITTSQGLLKEEMKPDFELLQSIFSRLYRNDLSKTFFSNHVAYDQDEGNGVTFHMQTYSSYRTNNGYDMPTLGKENVSQAERDKWVRELYPKFEEDLLANIVEYGKTLKNLQSNERLTFEVTFTQCKGCKIPESATYSIKMSDLSDYSSGKINKSKAISRINIKRGELQ